MTDRQVIVDQFLSGSNWASWARQPLAGDASARRYERLTHNGESVILMDADPANGEDTNPFAAMAKHLSGKGLCPPQILAHDPGTGLMIISDLGYEDFAKWLRHDPQDGRTLYRAAVDVLLTLHKEPVDLALKHLTPKTGGEMVSVLHPHYTVNSVEDLVRETSQSMINLAPNPDTLALRDYHAENLIWRTSEHRTDRVGLLDFQDAFITPAGYDLISLIRDARRDVDPKLAEDTITYFEEQAKTGPDFRTQLACLGVQRNLRILGVFARLARVHAKPHYLDLIPRVWRNLETDLQHPALKSLHDAVRDTLPAPTSDYLAELRA